MTSNKSIEFTSLKAWLLGFSIFLGTIAFSFASEKIQYGNGFGMDGQLYAAWVQHFDKANFHQLSVQRIFPSAFVHYTLKLLSIHATRDVIIASFQVLNSFCVALSAALFWLCCLHLHISRVGQSLGLISILSSFGVLKWLAYYPVITDGVALAIGSALFYTYVAQRMFSLVLVLLVASFTWPTAVYGGVLLILFPPRGAGSEIASRNRFWPTAGWRRVAALVGAITLVLISLYIFWEWNFTIPVPVITPIMLLLPISYFVLASYLFFGFYGVLIARLNLSPSALVCDLSIWSPIAILLLFGLPILRGLVFSLVSDEGGMELLNLKLIFTLPIVAPGKFIVAHVFFYGPIILLVVAFWKLVCAKAAQIGPGVWYLMGVGVAESISSESRHIIHLFPFLVGLVIAVLDKGYFNILSDRIFQVTFAILSILVGRFWMPIGGAPYLGKLEEQTYYMTQGPYTSHLVYFVQLAVVLAVGIILYLVWRRRSKHGARRERKSHQ
jgi:hypothetical protein